MNVTSFLIYFSVVPDQVSAHIGGAHSMHTFRSLLRKSAFKPLSSPLLIHLILHCAPSIIIRAYNMKFALNFVRTVRKKSATKIRLLQPVSLITNFQLFPMCSLQPGFADVSNIYDDLSFKGFDNASSLAFPFSNASTADVRTDLRPVLP